MQLYQLMRAGSHFAIAILLAKVGLSTTEIGNYEWMLWIGALFTTFWVNALLQTMPFTSSTLPEARREPFMRGSFVLFSGIAVILLLIISLVKGSLVPMLTGQAMLHGFLWFLLYLAFHLGTYPVEIWYLIKQDGRSIFFWGFFTFIVHIGALMIPLWLGYDLIHGLMAAAMLSAARWLFAAWLAFSRGSSLATLNELKLWMSTASPMIGQAFIAHLTVSFDAWLLGYVGTETETFALFRYASREFPLAFSMSTALGISMLPMLTTGWRSPSMQVALEAMMRKTSRLMYVVFPVGILLIFNSKWLFSSVFNQSFTAAAPLFSVYMLLTGARVLLPTTLLIAKGDTQPILWVSIAELIIKIVTGWIFYQAFGLIGLAWSAVLCALFEKCTLAFYLWRKHHVALNEYVHLPSYLFLFGCMILLVLLG